MFNGAGPLSGNSSLQSYGDGQYLTEPTPTLSGNKCPVCHKTFERLYNLKVHLRKHTGETPYNCPIKNCQKRFKWRSSMAHHVRAHHDISETMGIEVKCHARRSDQNNRVSNTIKKNVTQSVTIAASNLSSVGVKKTVRKKVSHKSTKIEPTSSEHGFKSQAITPANHVCNLPQWGIGQSFEETGPGFFDNIQSSIHTLKETDYIQPLEPASESIRREDNLQKDEEKNENDPLFQMVSEIFTRSTDMMQEYAATTPSQLHQDGISDELGLFLAVGSEDATDITDATDADMESQAHYRGNLSASTSKETQSSADMSFLLP